MQKNSGKNPTSTSASDSTSSSSATNSRPNSPTDSLAERAKHELPIDFKDNKAAQFEYGRRTEQKTLHFDPSGHRLNMGNPDIGDVDLGTIEADQPAQKDDNDHYDVAGDGDEEIGSNTKDR